MKHRIGKLYNTYANKLVEFSRLHGTKSWVVFLFIFTLVLAMATSGLATTSSNVTPQASSSLAQLETLPLPTSPYLTEIPNCNVGKESRGVWLTNIDSDVLFSPESTTKAIADLSTLNFNTLYPTVWNWGYTLYPSEVAKSVTGIELDPESGLQGRDILQEIIEQGHASGMGVIPWFEFGFMAPADSELAKRHPEWLVQRQDGSTIWWEGENHQRVWLNPLHPEVQQLITDLIVELVSNYDVDGIQVDDHFGYPSELGYDEYTVALYQKEHLGKQPPEDYQNADWVNWRASKITAYMEKLFQAIKAANPNAIVSVSPNPQNFSLNSFLMDWHTWERKGLIEELIVQVYRSSQSSFIAELSKPELVAAQRHIPVSIGILSGLKGRPVMSGQIKQQVRTVRDRNFAGVSFFFYESLWNMARETSEARKSTLLTLFDESVPRKDLSCKSAIGTQKSETLSGKVTDLGLS
ncbi:glycoside hydrolase family 10 protein [Hyella patelloides]|nr:glycoside hydrolase family 10 protein [Hyella patelloides]